jgi:predicted nucleic acid-binding protein
MQAENEPASQVVIDSSFVVRLLTRFPQSRYSSLWREWELNGVAVMAPSLITYEVTNALWQYEQNGDLSTDAAVRSVNRLNLLPIHLVSTGEMHFRALEIVRRFPERKAYDSHFVALADLLGCELWTSDKKLHNRVNRQLQWVKLVDE